MSQTPILILIQNLKEHNNTRFDDLQESIKGLGEAIKESHKDLNNRVSSLETAKNRVLWIAAGVAGILGAMGHKPLEWVKEILTTGQKM